MADSTILRRGPGDSMPDPSASSKANILRATVVWLTRSPRAAASVLPLLATAIR